jgi:hypothetical protein
VGPALPPGFAPDLSVQQATTTGDEDDDDGFDEKVGSFCDLLALGNGLALWHLLEFLQFLP